MYVSFCINTPGWCTDPHIRYINVDIITLSYNNNNERIIYKGILEIISKP